MGYIKEPEGVDFIIKSEPLTDKDRKEISQFIAEYKAKRESKQIHGAKKKNRTQQTLK